MAAPKSTASRNTLSVGVTTRLVVIESISADGSAAVCTDKNGYEVRVPLWYQGGLGRLPQVGQQWIVTQDILPSWSFQMFMGTGPADFLSEPSDLDLAALTGSWASLPVGNGWAVTGGWLKWRRWAWAETQLSGRLVAPSSGANGAVIATVPDPASRPASPHTFPVATTNVASGTVASIVTYAPAGTLIAAGVGNGATVSFDLKIPLDI